MSTRHLVDPQLLPLLELLPRTEFNLDTLPTIRSSPLPAFIDPDAEAKVAVSTRTIPGPSGAPDVNVLVYEPRQRSSSALPCIVHMHGGGYVVGTPTSSEASLRPMVAALGCVAVCVDYRLAPETPFPGGIEDCYAALAWVWKNSDELGVDPRRVGVMGESAGGGLAAALALLARDRGEFPVAFQHLMYPMLDDRTCVRPTPNPYTGEFLWNAVNNRFGWSSLLGGVAPGSDNVSPYAAAARAPNLAGLPPAFISTGALDLFLEEDLEYAQRLISSGVPVELHVYPGAFHAFDLDPTAEVAVCARRDRLSSLKRALGARQAPTAR
jgi:acetyl esterase/lipase